MSTLLFLVFAVAVLGLAAAAITGWRGEVCERGVGYVVPAAVEADPALSRRANDLVATWCTVAAVLAALPLLGLSINGFDRDLPLWVLVAAAAHGFLVVCVGGYPFERLKHMHDDAPRPTA